MDETVQNVNYFSIARWNMKQNVLAQQSVVDF